ncbi:VOC family protein [Planomicrobium sp. CPCC 101110]|uniref:VOC family protein n=1 Tax=Planomicrobium sp. CPCC 101110 TaxID=2599619 RepID=UPI0011B6EA24|nr:VOC family protein [Planomicrobium sp. CPCC 101110]TWT25941.1 extradiol dioxygenase [Planomicrobium sp. CPCC 101110]
MAKECWINLPVRDLQKSMDFFRALEFTVNEREDMAGVKVGSQGAMVMLIPEETFQSFTGSNIADTNQGNEVLLSISVNSEEEVHELVRKAESAGGAVYSEPGERNSFFGAGFSDVDGHKWNLLVM